MNPVLGILGGLTSAIPEVYKLIEGMRQRKEAKTGLDSLQRPEYNIPEEVQRALGISQMRYADKFMPGQGVYTDRIEQQASNAFAQSSEAGNPFGAIMGIQAQAGGQLQDMQTQAMNQQLQNEKAYQGQLENMGGYQEKKWQMNEFAPYKDKYTELRDMFGAGTQNIYGAMDNLAGIGTGLIGGVGQSLMGSMGTNKAQPIDQNAINKSLIQYQGGIKDPQVQQIMDALMNATTNNGSNGTGNQSGVQQTGMGGPDDMTIQNAIFKLLNAQLGGKF